MAEDAPPEAPDLPPLRTCPRCGREGRTRYERCPHCQSSYYARSRAQSRRRGGLVAGALAVLLVLAGVGTVFALSDRNDREAREKRQQTKLVAALRAKLTRIQAPHHGAAPELEPPADASDAQRLAARKALVSAVERRITADARARAAAGELDGPITSTVCGPILKARNAIPDDRVLSKDIGRYDCVAIKHAVIAQEGENVADLGHAFVAALNFKTYTYTWCRNTPAQGERGVALVFVRLDRTCLAAKGKALGTGYAAMPGEENETSDDVATTAG